MYPSSEEPDAYRLAAIRTRFQIAMEGYIFSDAEFVPTDAR
jgi:hypothetical protein